MIEVKWSPCSLLALGVSMLALLGVALAHNAGVDSKHKEILAIAPEKLGDILSLVDISSKEKDSVPILKDMQGCTVGGDADCQREAEGASAISSTFPGEFVPTHGWQVVEEGQMIPGGLHIRMNLSTGKKEAKLLE